MAEVFLNCPQCHRQLRVTEDLIGQPVKCPACEFTFTVGPDSGEPQPVLSVTPVALQQPEGEWNQDQARLQRARALVMPPAIALLVATLIGFLGDIYVSLMLKTNRPEVEKQLRDMVAARGQPVSVEEALRVTLVIHEVCAVLSLMIILASIQMLRLRTYPLAVLGCFLAMVDCGSYCCLIDLPLGIWGLVILLRPEVREAFD
jgi:hypothetical protein